MRSWYLISPFLASAFASCNDAPVTHLYSWGPELQQSFTGHPWHAAVTALFGSAAAVAFLYAMVTNGK